MVRDKKYFIQMALDKAWTYQGLTYPNPPVCSVITDIKDNFISLGVHEYSGGPHAEVNAIKNAYHNLTNDTNLDFIKDSAAIHEYLFINHNGIFRDKNIYVTLEPCNHHGKTPPCANLILELGFKKIFIGTLDPNKNASGGAQKLIENGLHVEVGILGEKCKSLIEPFKLWQQKTFVFFKLAMSANGVIDGGTITCKESRILVHALRDKVDLLVIGGNTVRVDRPTLDARLSDGRAPDVLIYSKNKDFDKNIPLFSVPNRKVLIADNFDILSDYNYVMIEGGEGMLKAVKDFVDWFLIFRSPHFKKGFSPSLEISLKEEFSMSIGEDRVSWFTKIYE